MNLDNMNLDRSPHLKKAKELWKEFLTLDDVAVDATSGNGHDTLFLSGLTRHVYAMDIQEKAVNQTKKLLEEKLGPNWREKVSLSCRSHVDFGWICQAPKLVVYNLGYLPGGGNKELTTQTQTTIQSLENAWKILRAGGAISVTCYPGHAEGEREERAVLEWAKGKPFRHYTWPEKIKSPSVLLFVRD